MKTRLCWLIYNEIVLSLWFFFLHPLYITKSYFPFVFFLEPTNTTKVWFRNTMWEMIFLKIENVGGPNSNEVGANSNSLTKISGGSWGKIKIVLFLWHKKFSISCQPHDLDRRVILAWSLQQKKYLAWSLKKHCNFKLNNYHLADWKITTTTNKSFSIPI